MASARVAVGWGVRVGVRGHGPPDGLWGHGHCLGGVDRPVDLVGRGAGADAVTDAEIVEIQGFHKFCDAPCRYDVDCDRTHEGLFRVLNTLLETRAALRNILYASDGCRGHRDCNHGMEPWSEARRVLEG